MAKQFPNESVESVNPLYLSLVIVPGKASPLLSLGETRGVVISPKISTLKGLNN